MEELYRSLSKLISNDTSSGLNFHRTVNELKSIFSYSKSCVELYNGEDCKALLFGVNCKLIDLNDAIVFSGHIDTVNSKASRVMKIKDNSIYGLGTADMKSFFACIDYCFKKNKMTRQSKTPIIIAVSFDEEKDNKGICSIIEYIKTHNIIPIQCIVGEPTNVCVSTRCRGCYDYILSVYSRHAHVTDSCVDNPVEICTQSGLILKNKQTEQNTISICYFDCEKSFNTVSNECSMGFEIRSYNYNEVVEIIKELSTFLGEDINYNLQKKDNYLIPLDNSNSNLVM